MSTMSKMKISTLDLKGKVAKAGVPKSGESLSFCMRIFQDFLLINHMSSCKSDAYISNRNAADHYKNGPSPPHPVHVGSKANCFLLSLLQ